MKDDSERRLWRCLFVVALFFFAVHTLAPHFRPYSSDGRASSGQSELLDLQAGERFHLRIGVFSR